ncbi:MAG: 2-carboxy-1,4-naphthoquinone phytyltransferase [Cyanobacteria bacterium P01_H01_bin.15]
MTNPELSVPSQRKLWLAAIKPPMYSVAIMPILLGSAIAYGETGSFAPRIFWTFLSAAILILVWLNLTNDVFDADTGIDVNKAHSIVTLTGNKPLIFALANGLLAIAGFEILLLGWWQQDWTVIGLITSCVVLGYSYQGPPFRLGYLGLGEPICFVTFGPLAVLAAYYAQTQTFSKLPLFASVILGVTTTAILFCSHFHQVTDDLAAGKKSPIVRLGTARGANVLVGMVVAVYLWLTVGLLWGVFPNTLSLTFLSLPWAWRLGRFVAQNHGQPASISGSKFLAIYWQFSSGVLLCLSFVWLHYQ